MGAQESPVFSVPLIVGAGVASSSSTSPARDQPSAQFLRLDLLYYKAGAIASLAAAFVFSFFFFLPLPLRQVLHLQRVEKRGFLVLFVCLRSLGQTVMPAMLRDARPRCHQVTWQKLHRFSVCHWRLLLHMLCVCVCVTCACIHACLFFCLLFTRFRTACIVFPLCLASIVVCCCSLNHFDNTLLISFNSSVAIEVLAIVTFLHLWAFQP